MDKDTWTNIGIGAFLVLCLAALIGGITGTVYGFDNHSTHVGCLRLHEQTGLETKVARSGMTTECYVKTESGHWIPEDRYRGVDGDGD